MTPTEASKILKNEIKGIKTIKICKDYEKDYLFVAFETNTPNNEIDPFYLVDKNTGKVRKFNIAGDTEKFYNTPNIEF